MLFILLRFEKRNFRIRLMLFFRVLQESLEDCALGHLVGDIHLIQEDAVLCVKASLSGFVVNIDKALLGNVLSAGTQIGDGLFPGCLKRSKQGFEMGFLCGKFPLKVGNFYT